MEQIWEAGCSESGQYAPDRVIAARERHLGRASGIEVGGVPGASFGAPEGLLAGEGQTIGREDGGQRHRDGEKAICRNLGSCRA